MTIIYADSRPITIPTVQTIDETANENEDISELLMPPVLPETLDCDVYIPEEEQVKVSLNTSSIEKDLKIKFVNTKSNKVITGVDFNIIVTDPTKKIDKYNDKDKDGIIYLQNIPAGKYKIQLQETDGYILEKDTVEATVKDKIEYKKVEVVDEVKTENEINVKQEDAAYNENKDTSTKNDTKKENTVESVKSDKVIISAEKVQKVDAFGQKMYSKQKIDRYGTPMYSVILDEPVADHIDNDNDGICDRCKKTLHEHKYEKQIKKEETCTEDGEYVLICTCGNIKEQGIIPRHHIDEDGDNICDKCGEIINKNEEKIEEEQSLESAKEIQTQQISEQKNESVVNVIVYDTKSAPIYDETSDPIYETVKEEYKYTGWQTIDGKTYYFDKNGNKVTGTQVIDGIQYTFGSDGVRQGTIGIDVSKFQTSIDWAKVKNAGINFVMIRCGYRGYGSGVLVEDPMFKSHISGAKKAGLRVGIYFFSQAISEAEAVEEASMAIQLANKYGINMPIAIDSEFANNGAGRADKLSKGDRTKITKAFCNTVKNSGYQPMVYASKSWFSAHLDISSLNSFYIWVAHYADKCGYSGRYEIWQNTSKGKVDGVNGNVDMNISSI